MKFDISALKSLLPYLKSAELELSCTATDATARYVFASGISDTSWQETTLNGELRNPNADWKNGYNRLNFLKGVIAQGKLNFDVTTWIFDQPNGIVSFKIHDLNSTTSSVKIASKENPTIDFRPKLKLTFWDNSTDVASLEYENKYTSYPNPAKDSFKVQGNDISQIEMFTLSGQKLLFTNHSYVDVSDLENGVYLVKIKNTIGNNYFSKIIISN
jgi:hypothetical protein